ncbi:MAG: recombination regulator RecX [Rhabdochlamydiaceae bacterium]|nr:recombination regulator RecX [Rhabdochlamydiaceae bacterium]
MLSFKDHSSDSFLLDLFWGEELFCTVVKKLFFKELRRLSSLLDFAEFKQRWRELEVKIAKQEVIKLLSKKGYLSDELRQKLALKHFSDESIEQAISFTQTSGYIDDEIEIQRLVKSSLRKGKGPKAVLHQLKQKRIAAPLINEARTPLFEGEKSALEAWVQKKYGSIDFADRVQRQKVIGQLIRRGFSPELIFSTLNGHEDWH